MSLLCLLKANSSSLTSLTSTGGVLPSGQVLDFVNSFCAQFKIPVPTQTVEELIESGREIKFHDFVMLALLLTRDLRENKKLELDEELKADDEDSTSEAADSDAVDSEDESAEECGEKSDENPISPFKKSALSNSRKSIAMGSPVVQRIRGRLRAGSVRKDGLLQYVTLNLFFY